MINEVVHEIMVYKPNSGPPKIMPSKDALEFPPPPLVQPEEISTLIISESRGGDKIIVAMLINGELYYKMSGVWHNKNGDPYRCLKNIEKGIKWTYK